MPLHEKTIMLHKAEMTVKGNYYPGRIGTYEDPPEHEEFEIEHVSIGDVDVTELLNYYPDIYEEIEEKVLESMERDRDII